MALWPCDHARGCSPSRKYSVHFPAGHPCLHLIYFNVLIFSFARYTSSALFNNDNVALLVCRPVPALPLWHAAWSHLRWHTLPIGSCLPL